MKKLGFGTMVLIFFGAILGAGCKGPKEALTAYLDAVNKGSAISAYKLVSSNDKSFTDLKQYLADFSAQRNNLVRAFPERVTYKIKSVEKKGDQASVTVNISAPDYPAIITDVFGGDLGALGGESAASIKRTVEQAYKGGKIPMTDNEWVYQLVKEEDGWRVYLGWEADAQIRNLLQQAEQLEKAGKLYEAKSKYQEVLQSDAGNAEVSARMPELERLIAKYEQAQAYLANLAVANTRVMGSVGGGQGIFTEIKNNGDRTLAVVEITVDFLDSQGNVIGSKTFVPVDDSRKKYDEAYAALTPGGSRKFGVSAQDAPAGWAGKVKVRVSEVQFAE